jgi:uncharacterized paraquat-inducible protein A
MLNMGIMNRQSAAPKMQMDATLWRCDQCNSFISIHSAQFVNEAFCPTCGDAPLEFCGSFGSILGIQFADA